MIKKLLLVLILINYNSFSQELYFKTISTEDGLSNNSVNDIENDKNGSLWIGTWDGLNYYDGNEITVYKHRINDSTSIAENEIKRILRDKNDSIWVLSNYSISKYLGNGKFKNYQLPSKTQKIILLKPNKVVVKFENNTYVKYHNNKFQRTLVQEEKDKEKQIYQNILLSEHPNLQINDILSDKGRILFATRKEGLFTLELKNNTYNIQNYKRELYNSNSIKSNEIEEIHKDLFGGIWLAFKDGGISLIQQFITGISTIYPHPVKYPHLPLETIRAIVKDKQENIWLGYYSKGLYRYDENIQCFLPFKISKSKENQDWNRIRSLFKDSTGAIWVGTYAGIMRIQNEEIHYFNADDYNLFPNNRNYSFFEDEDKKLWIGCWGGVAKLDVNTLQFEEIPNQEKLKDLHVRNIYKHQSELIIATENKSLVIHDLKAKTQKIITEKQGLAGNSVFSIVHIKDLNQFWIASLGGITILNNKKEILKTITEKDGLPSHMVYSLLEVGDKIWGSTTKGVFKVNKRNCKVERINISQKWQAKEFSEGAYFKDCKNTLYFGGFKGLNYFNPNKLKITTNLPKLNVTIDESVDKTITKEHTKNYLKAKITPVTFEKNPNNKVLYKLEGYDKEWKELKYRDVFYKYIPAGDYKFLVKNSLDSDNQLISYDVKIEKPFYFSYTFLLSLALLLILRIIYYQHKKNQLAKKYREKLELEIAKRTETIENQNKELLKLHNSLKNNDFEVDKFKRYIVKKFKQPLTLILENVSDIAIFPEKQDLVTNEVKSLINKVLKWDSLEEVSVLSGYKKTITTSKTIKENLQSYKHSFTNVDFKVSFSSTVQFIETDIVRIKLIFQYLMNVFLNYKVDNTDLIIDIEVTEEGISVNIKTTNQLFIQNVNYVEKYNSYYDSFKKLLCDVEGSLQKQKGDNQFEIEIKIPVKIPATNTNHEANLKKTIIDLNNLPKNKKIILVYAKQEDFNIAKCLLEEKEYHLIFEKDLRDVSKYISKTQIFDLLVFYNSNLSSKMIELSNFITKNKALPTIYISEKIDYFLQEKIEGLHIDEVIQLPVSKKYIQNKIKHQLNISTTFNEEKLNIISANQKYVEEAIKIIQENYGNPNFNIEFLIEKLKISRVKCYRMFKEVLHQPPSDYINQYRMKKALDFMKEGNLNISQISFECGYNDPKYFSKTFKKFYGETPKRYIEQFLQNA